MKMFAACLVVATGTFALGEQSIGANETNGRSNSLAVILDSADRICSSIPIMGTDTTVELTIDAKTKLDGLVATVANMGVEEAAKYKTDAYKGILRNQLVQAIKNNTECKLAVLDLLRDKMLNKSNETSRGAQADLSISITGRNDSEAHMLLGRLRQQTTRLFLGNIEVLATNDNHALAKHRLLIDLEQSKRGHDFFLSGTLTDSEEKIVAEFPYVTINQTDLDSAPSVILYGLDISPATLKPLHSKERPTGSLEAYAKYEAARRAYAKGNYDDAIRSFLAATKIDPQFAMAYWSIGEILTKRPYVSAGGRNAAYWKKKATAINFDHPKWPLDPGGSGDPVPSLRSLLSHAKSETIDGYSFATVSSTDYGIRIFWWSFPEENFDIRVVAQRGTRGQTVNQFLAENHGFLAVNGGFYEIDEEKRVGPTGLVVVDHVADPGRRPASGGSGVLYRKDRAWHLVRADEFSNPSKAEYALQNGPRLVEHGGVRGIRSDNGSALNRTAVCLAKDLFEVLVIDGGVTLSQLSVLMSTPKDQGGLGCDAALNLDGGPSTQMAYVDGERQINVKSTDVAMPIPNAIVVRKLE